MLRGPVDRDGFRHLPGPQSWAVGTPGSGPPDHWRGDAKKSPVGLQRGCPGDALPPSLQGGGPRMGEWTPQSQLNQWVLWVTLSSSPPPLVSWLSHP